jgi:uncharacterized protein (UPF0210 family)
MKIRTITQFTPMTWPVDRGSIASASRFLMDARLRLSEAGFEVQSTCLATPPFLDVIGDPAPDLLLKFAHTLEELANKYHIDTVSIGPVIATTPLSILMSIRVLPQVVAETEKIYSGVLFADEYSGVNLAAAHALAQTIHQIAHATPGGLGNLRLGALANVLPNAPLAHTAYHYGSTSFFAIGTEAADLALSAINNTPSIREAQECLIEAIEVSSAAILGIADALVDDHQIRFKGIDFSLAPALDQAGSIGAAVEKLGLDVFGSNGTLFALAFLANAIQQANIPRTGFSGVMLPVLGDTTLAQRAAEGHFDINDLLLYSAVCGAGLDIIPIPGDTTVDEIAALFVDMAALAIFVKKPMSARLMPIPGLSAGDEVSFNTVYLSGGRVLPVKKMGSQKLFERNSFLRLAPLPHRKRGKPEFRFARTLPFRKKGAKKP